MRRLQKPLAHLLCAMPLAWIVWRGLAGDLGANPVETVNRFLGDWGLRFLLIVLAVTPLRLVSGWTGVMRFRRLLGLYAFFYVCLHLNSYLGLDLHYDVAALWKDIVKRRYITLGMIGVVLLVPLAVTSTVGWIKRLGAKRWKALHRLVYVAGILGVVHFFMMIKAYPVEPLIYGAILAGLFAIRLIKARRAD